MKSISYAIPVCNEIAEIKRLAEFLVKNKQSKDEIVILVDENNHTQEVKDFVEAFAEECSDQNVLRAYFPLNGDFASFKNHLNSLCSNDYICQIDADEMVSTYLMDNIGLVLEYNPIDMIRMPRINTVEGLTEEHIKKWRWRVDENGRVNFPDFQTRIYKNDPEIKSSSKWSSSARGKAKEKAHQKAWCATKT
jgi:hypothetical protein